MGGPRHPASPGAPVCALISVKGVLRTLPMPAGLTNPVLGYAGFCAVKLAGYSLAGWYLSRSYSRPDIGAFRVGATRTLIGMATGALYVGVWWASGQLVAGPASYLYLAGLLPVRLAEWWLLIWLFYDRKLAHAAKGWRNVSLGTAWSYLLDAPAIAGLLVAGGFWVC
jgi:hypothetical protein